MNTLVSTLQLYGACVPISGVHGVSVTISERDKGGPILYYCTNLNSITRSGTTPHIIVGLKQGCSSVPVVYLKPRATVDPFFNPYGRDWLPGSLLFAKGAVSVAEEEAREKASPAVSVDVGHRCALDGWFSMYTLNGALQFYGLIYLSHPEPA